MPQIEPVAESPPFPVFSPGAVNSPRDTLVLTTASLAANAGQSGLVASPSGQRVLRVASNRAARIRVYASAAKRDADVSRLLGTDPTGDHGLLLELQTFPTLLSYTLAATVDMHQADVSDTGFYWRVTNLDSGAGVVTVTLTTLQTEA